MTNLKVSNHYLKFDLQVQIVSKYNVKHQQHDKLIICYKKWRLLSALIAYILVVWIYRNKMIHIIIKKMLNKNVYILSIYQQCT